MRLLSSRPLTRNRGHSLVEILVVVTIIILMGWMTTTVYLKLRKKAEAAACKKKVKNIGIALLNAMNTREDGYPSPPDTIDDNSAEEQESDVDLDKWWFETLNEHGLDNPEDFVCPRDNATFKRLTKEKGVQYFSSYTITPNEGKIAPLKYNTPWVSDKMPHEGKMNVYLPDGTVAEFPWLGMDLGR